MLPDDELEEEDNANELETRIKAPIVWTRLEDRVRIEDLQERRYDEALALIKDHYLNTHSIYKCVNILEDDEAVEEYLSNARVQLKDKTSLSAIDESSGNLIGVMILRIVDREAFSRTFSKLKIRNSRHFSTVMKFYNHVERSVDIHQIYQTSKYLKIFTVAIHPQFRGKGIGLSMYKCSILLAKSLHVPIIIGIFTTARGKELVDGLGFEILHEVNYVKYMEKQKYLFSTGDGSHGAALMVMKIQYKYENGSL